MFEDVITTLDSLGVEYEEDYDNGTLSINIADVDKSTLVEIINSLMGMDYTIDDSSITVNGGEVLPEEPSEDAEAAALDEAASGMSMEDLNLG